MRQGREVKGGMGSVLEGGRARVRGGGSRHRDGRGMWGQQKVKWRRVLDWKAFLCHVFPVVCPRLERLFLSSHTSARQK